MLAGAVEDELARAAGIGPGLITACPTPSELFDTVFQGRAAAGALTDISLRALLARHPRANLEVTPGFARTLGSKPARSVGGFAFRPADTDLREAFSAGLLALQASGKWLRIAAPFGVSATNLPPRDQRTADLCRSG